MQQKVDIVRISLCVQKNLTSADQEENIQDEKVSESQIDNQSSDVKLGSKNVVLNFSDSQPNKKTIIDISKTE